MFVLVWGYTSASSNGLPITKGGEEVNSAYEMALAKMGCMYTNVAASGVDLLREGSVPNPMIRTCEGNTSIVFGFTDPIANWVARLSQRIGELVPVTYYPASHVQTTINAVELRRPYRSGQADTERIERICAAIGPAVTTHLEGHGRAPRYIELARPVANRDCVLLPGFPSETTFALAEAIVAACRTAEVPVIDRWGSQIVVARFQQELPGERYLPVLDLLDSQPKQGQVRAVAVNVIENIMGEDGQFECVTHASFRVG